MTDDDYNPHHHRNRPHATNNLETLCHLLKSAIGTGILAMPDAYKNTGFITGTILTCFLTAMLTYCLHILVKAQYKMCKQQEVPLIKYPQSMKIAVEMGPQCMRKCGKYMPIIVDGFLILNQTGNCCIYIVFIAENFKLIVDVYLKFNISIELYILGVCFIPCTLMLAVRNLKWLAPFSVGATVMSFLTIAVVLYYVSDVPPIEERSLLGDPKKYPLFFGTVLFAVSAIGVFVSVENNMKTPQDFLGMFGILNIATVIIIIPYIVVGFMGYWKHGDDTKGSITLNFPASDWLAAIINLSYSISIIISYGLQGYVAFEIIWGHYEETASKHDHSVAWEYLVRTGLVFLTFLLATAAPFLGLIISLFGALCVSSLGIIFPAIADFCVNWEEGKSKGAICLAIKDLAIIIFGLLGLIAGTYASLYGIFFKLKEDSANVRSRFLNVFQ